MTTEELKIQIKLEIQNAINNAKQFSEEIKKAVGESKKALPSNEKVKQIIEQVGTSMRQTAQVAQLLGDKTRGLVARHNELAGGIKQLIASGLSPEAKEVKQLAEQYKRLDAQLTNTQKKTTDFQSMLGKATAVVGVGVAFKQSLDHFSEIENLQTSFGTLLGDMEKGAKHLQEIKAWTAVTPYDTASVATASKTMLQFGIDSESIMPTLMKLGDVALGDKEKLKGLALVMSQVSSAGKLQGQDLMQMINQGWNPLNEIAKKTGKSMAELRKDMENGEISFKMVSDALNAATSEGGLFFNGMAAGSENMSVKISTMTDSLLNAGASILSILAPALKVGADLLTAIANGIEATPAPVKIALITVAIVALIAVKQRLIIEYGKEIAMQLKDLALKAQSIALAVAKKVKDLAEIVITGLKTIAQNVFNGSMIVTLSLTGVGIALVGAAIAAGAGYIASMGQQASAMGDMHAAAKTMQESVENLTKAQKDYKEAMSNNAILGDTSKNQAIRKQYVEASIQGYEDMIIALGKEGKSLAKNKEQYELAANTLRFLGRSVDTYSEATKKAANMSMALRKELKKYKDELAAMNKAEEDKQAKEQRIKAEADEYKRRLDAIRDFRKKMAEQYDLMLAKKQEFVAALTLDANNKDNYAVVTLEVRKIEQEAIDKGVATRGKDGNLKATNKYNIEAVEQIKALTLDMIEAAKLKELERIDAVYLKQAEIMASLTTSKADDLQLDMYKEIEAANKVFTNDKERLAILAQIETSYREKIASAQAEDMYAAATAQANQTATKVDDLTVERDMRLETLKLISASEEEIADYRKKMEEEIAGVRKEEAKKAAEEKSGGSSAEAQLVGASDIARLATAEDPLGEFISILLSAISDVQVISDALNAITKTIKAITKGFNVQIVRMLDPILSKLEAFGEAIGIIIGKVMTLVTPVTDLIGDLIEVVTGILNPLATVLVPILNLVRIAMLPVILLFKAVSAILSLIVIPVLKLLGAAFSWFNDNVIVPVGNAFIDVINAIVDGINSVLGLFNVSLKRLDRLLTTAETEALQTIIETKTEIISDLLDDVSEYYQIQRDKLKELTSKQIDSWKDLLDVGAISEQTYASKVAGLNTQLAAELANMDTNEERMIEILQGIRDDLAKGIDRDITQVITDTNAVTGQTTGTTPVTAPAPAAPSSGITDDTVVKFMNMNITIRELKKILAKWEQMLPQLPAGAQAQVTAMINAVKNALRALHVPGYAVGTDSVYGDQVAQIHNGEMIIPRSFSDAVRQNKLSISGPGTKGSNAATVIENHYHYNIEGSMIRERQLSKDIQKNTTRMSKSGRIKVGV